MLSEDMRLLVQRRRTSVVTHSNHYELRVCFSSLLSLSPMEGDTEGPGCCTCSVFVLHLRNTALGEIYLLARREPVLCFQGRHDLILQDFLVQTQPQEMTQVMGSQNLTLLADPDSHADAWAGHGATSLQTIIKCKTRWQKRIQTCQPSQWTGIDETRFFEDRISKFGSKKYAV